MALNVDDIQTFLGSDDSARSQFRSESGSVGRAWIDGVLVVYDLADAPAWLVTVLDAQDEDGNTTLDKPRAAVG
jgi:hypothetical protein